MRSSSHHDSHGHVRRKSACKLRRVAVLPLFLLERPGQRAIVAHRNLHSEIAVCQLLHP